MRIHESMSRWSGFRQGMLSGAEADRTHFKSHNLSLLVPVVCWSCPWCPEAAHGLGNTTPCAPARGLQPLRHSTTTVAPPVPCSLFS